MTISLNDVPTTNTLGMPIQLNCANGAVSLVSNEAMVLNVTIQSITLGPRILRPTNQNNLAFNPGYIALFKANGNDIDLQVAQPNQAALTYPFA